MKVKLVATVVFLLGGALSTPWNAAAAAAPSNGTCQDSGTQISVGGASVFADPAGCTTTVACPKKQRSHCLVALGGEVTGNGVVGLNIRVEGASVTDCSDALACSASGEIHLAPGTKAPIDCDFAEGAAHEATVSCEWSITMDTPHQH